MTRRVEVVAPGLAGAFSESEYEDATWSKLDFKIQSLLARADKIAVNDTFSFKSGFGQDHLFLLPVAMNEYRFFNNAGVGDKFCLYADPVYLELRTDHAVLYNDSHLHIDNDEWQQLADRFNQYFIDFGLYLEQVGKRWYLRSTEKPANTMFPTGSVLGRNVKHFMPAGNNSAFWLQALNETQMLFHSSPVNQARLEAGKPTITGLWFWGGGTGKLSRPENMVFFANRSWVRGLCQSHHIGCFALQDLSSIAKIEDERMLVYDDRLLEPASTGDLFLWQKKLAEFENIVIKPLLALLKNGHIDEIVFLTEHAAYLYKHRHKYRIFRRKKSMKEICSGSL